MEILHTIECTRYSVNQQAHVCFTRHLSRPYRLTYKGAERILRREDEEGGMEHAQRLTVARISTAIYQRSR